MGGELYNGHAFKEHMEESYITFPGELLPNLTFESCAHAENVLGKKALPK